MNIILRSTLVLAGALGLGGGLAEAAFAGDLTVAASLSGAGRINNLSTPCERSAPADERAVLECVRQTFRANKAGHAEVMLHAEAVPGWKFAGWAGCDRITSEYYCSVASDGTQPQTRTPRARFIDAVFPEVTDVRATPKLAADHTYTFTWTGNKAGMTYQCELDGRRFPCTSGAEATLSEGDHRFDVEGTDMSGRRDRAGRFDLPVVDTEIVTGPVEGSFVGSPISPLVARTSLGREFECALDGGAFRACGQRGAGNQGALTLPALADGPHTVKVRGKFNDAVDAWPASRTWTVDTVAPETTLTETKSGFDIGSNEPGTFRCRVDAEPFADCDATYPRRTLPPGTHTFEVYAVDRAGNADASPATAHWTVKAPPVVTPVPTPTPVAPPVDQPAPAAPAAPAAVPAASAPVPATAPAAKRVAFKLRYTYRKGRLTRLKAVGVPAGAKLRVTVKRPKHKPTRASLRTLVGKRLPRGTKITVAVGATARTITLR